MYGQLRECFTDVYRENKGLFAIVSIVSAFQVFFPYIGNTVFSFLFHTVKINQNCDDVTAVQNDTSYVIW